MQPPSEYTLYEWILDKNEYNLRVDRIAVTNTFTHLRIHDVKYCSSTCELKSKYKKLVNAINDCFTALLAGIITDMSDINDIVDSIKALNISNYVDLKENGIELLRSLNDVIGTR